MAKTKRRKIGSIVKGRDGKPDYFQAYIKDQDGKPGSYVLKDGQFLDLESKAKQLADIKFLVENDKIDADTGKYLTDRVNKIPEYVRFEVIVKEKN